MQIIQLFLFHWMALLGLRYAGTWLLILRMNTEQPLYMGESLYLHWCASPFLHCAVRHDIISKPVNHLQIRFCDIYPTLLVRWFSQTLNDQWPWLKKWYHKHCSYVQKPTTYWNHNVGVYLLNGAWQTISYTYLFQNSFYLYHVIHVVNTFWLICISMKIPL